MRTQKRYVVRSVSGWRIRPGGTRASATRGLGGVTVWVADEVLNGREVKVWRSETMGGSRGREARIRAAFNAARMLAATLNNAERYEARKAAA